MSRKAYQKEKKRRNNANHMRIRNNKKFYYISSSYEKLIRQNYKQPMLNKFENLWWNEYFLEKNILSNTEKKKTILSSPISIKKIKCLLKTSPHSYKKFHYHMVSLLDSSKQWNKKLYQIYKKYFQKTKEKE